MKNVSKVLLYGFGTACVLFSLLAILSLMSPSPTKPPVYSCAVIVCMLTTAAGVFLKKSRLMFAYLIPPAMQIFLHVGVVGNSNYAVGMFAGLVVQIVLWAFMFREVRKLEAAGTLEPKNQPDRKIAA
jgi:hypothetical protein